MPDTKTIMKKYVACILVIMLFLSMLAGCGQSSGGNAGGAANKEAAATTAAAPANAAPSGGSAGTFRAYHMTALTDMSTDTDRAWVGWLEKLKEKNEIPVEIEVVPHDSYETKLKAYAVAGNIPDLFSTKAGILPELNSAKLLMPLDPAFEADPDWFKTLKTGELGEYKVDGKHFAIGNGGGGNCVVYYRKSILNSVGYDGIPKDWDEYINMLGKIKETGVTPVVLGNNGKSNGPSCWWNTMAYKYVDQNWYADVKNYRNNATFNDPRLKTSLEQLLRIVKGGYVNADYAAIDEGGANQIYLQGKAAINMVGFWFITGLVQNAASDETGVAKAVFDDTEIGRLPAPAGQEAYYKNYAASCGWGFAIGSGATGKKYDMAVDFLKFKTSPEYIKIQLEQGDLPVVDYVLMDVKYDKSKVNRLWNDYLVFYNESNVIPVWDCELSAAFQEAEYNGFADLLAGSVTIDDYLKNLQAAHESAK